MSCASGIYTVFNGNESIVAGANLPLGTTVRRYGRNLMQSGDGILLDGMGYYKIDALVTLLVPAPTPAPSSTTTTTPKASVAEGNVAVELVADGEVIQGSVSETSQTGTIVVPVQAIVRKKCYDTPTTVQIKLDDNSVGATVLRTNLTIIKI